MSIMHLMLEKDLHIFCVNKEWLFLEFWFQLPSDQTTEMKLEFVCKQ